MPAFAITIHKSQGLSIKSAIVDAGPCTFGSGMVYVALSRVTTLDGLHLIDLNRSRIKCDKKAIDEYNRLRRMYTDLGDIRSGNMQCDEEDVQQALTKSINHNNRERGRKRTLVSEVDAKDADTVPGADQLVKRRRVATKQSEGQADNAAVVVAETHNSIFEFCDIESLAVETQQIISQRLNLHFVTSDLSVTSVVHKAVSNKMQALIYADTQQTTNIVISQVMGDGNCLFRSLSLGLTGTQDQHELIRSYVVNHMLHSDIQQQLEHSFQTRTGTLRPRQKHPSYIEHLAAMQQNGEWGTEHEIIAAAHLFDCSIVCYSRYNSKQFCLQHFPPHFLASGACTSDCKHHTLYLTNSSGVHYNLATVSLSRSTEE
jgi:hypothetical protein